MTEAPVIETARLRLRPWRKNDLDRLAEIYCDPDVMRNIGPGTIRSRAQTVRGMVRMRASWDQHGFGMWALEVADSGELIGRQGLSFLDNTPEIEIGYCLAKDAWGHGYATGVRPGGGSVRLRCSRPRPPRRHHLSTEPGLPGVLTKCGLSYVGERRYYDVDVHYFALSRDQWQAIEATG